MASEVNPSTGTPTGIGVDVSAYTVRNAMRSQLSSACADVTRGVFTGPRPAAKGSIAVGPVAVGPVAVEGAVVRRAVVRNAADSSAQERLTRCIGPPDEGFLLLLLATWERPVGPFAFARIFLATIDDP